MSRHIFLRLVGSPLKLAISLLFLQAGVALGRGDDFVPSFPVPRKMVSIVLPNVEFHQTTLEAALEFLRQESRRVDPEPDPEGRGVNLILQSGALLQANPRITLNLRHVPLGEVLKYVASQVGLRVKVEPYAVSLVSPTDATEPLVTTVIPISPTFLGNFSPVHNEGNVRREHLD